MKLGSVLGSFSDEALVEGGEQARIRERDELRRRRRLAVAAGLRRIPVEDLTFGRFGYVEHVSGERFRVASGEITDALYSNAVAVTTADQSSGEPVFLEAV